MPAGTVFPLAASDIVRKVARGQRAEHDPGCLPMELLPRARPEAETGDDLVGAAGEELEHRFRFGRVCRLAERLAFDDDLRIDAEHGPFTALDGARLPRR